MHTGAVETLVTRDGAARGVTGHGPWGMLNAPATGRALAGLIADGAPSVVDLRPFDPARLRPAAH